MNRTLTKGILSVVVSLAAVALLASPARAHGPGRRACLAPNDMDDDTEALQSALDRCSGATRRCVVRLCEGRFWIAPVRVGDFRGVLKGAGRGRTIIQALPNLQVNNDTDGYWKHDPLDPKLDPWPYLLQFIGGNGTVRDLKIEVPSSETYRPTQGWTEFNKVENHELAGAILVTGQDPARFEVTRIAVGAGKDLKSDFETTLLAGVTIRGLLENLGDLSTFNVHPVRGRYRVSDSTFVGMLTGVSLGELGDADVTVRRNETRAFVAVDLLDASRSRVRVLENRWTIEALGFNALLNIDGDPSEDNTVLIYKNRGSIGSFSGEGSGIYFQDLLIPPEPGDSTVIVFGNHLDVGSADEPAFSAVEIYGAGRLHVSRNTLRGHVAVLPGLGGGMGIGIDQTTGCRIERNRLDGLETGVGHDLHLGLETSDCVAFVGRHDDVDNDGTNNRIIRR